MNPFYALLLTMGRAAAAEICGVAVGLLLLIISRRRGLRNLSILVETLACVPAVVVSRLLSSVLPLPTMVGLLVGFATIFPTYILAAPFFEGTVASANTMMRTFGSRRPIELWRGVAPYILFPAIQSFRLLWPTALLVTMIVECSGSQSHDGFGYLIIPTLSQGHQSAPFVIACSLAALIPFMLLQKCEKALAAHWGLERHVEPSLATNEIVGALRMPIRFVTRYGICCLMLGVLAVVAVDLAGGIPPVLRLFSVGAEANSAFVQSWFVAVVVSAVATLGACAVAIIAGAALAFFATLASAYGPAAAEFAVNFAIMIPQAVPLLVFISLFQSLFYRHSAIGFLAIIISTVFFPMYECAIGRMRKFLQGSRAILLAAGVEPRRAPFAILRGPIVDGLWIGAKIGASRAIAAAVIAGYLIPNLTFGPFVLRNFGLGGMAKATAMTDLQEIAGIAFVAVVTSVVLIDLTQTISLRQLARRIPYEG